MPAPVLVHGAWQGAWVWGRVADLLRRAGFPPITVTLSGSGERASELSPSLDLQTHVSDVVDAVSRSAGDEADLVLVGHSYAGMVLPGAAAALSGRVKALVFVDAFYPSKGGSAFDQMPEVFRRAFRQRAEEEGDGWRLPPHDGLLDVWGLHDAEDRAWVRSQLTDWSLAFFDSPSQVDLDDLRPIPRWVVHGTGNYPAGPPFAAIAEDAGRHGAIVVGLPTGHDVMVEAPEGLTDVILGALGS